MPGRSGAAPATHAAACAQGQDAATRTRRPSARAGSIRWLASRSSSASLPITSRSAGRRNAQQRRPVQRPGQLGHQGVHVGGFRGATIHRAGQRGRQQETERGGHIGQGDPGPVLPAVAERPADAQRAAAAAAVPRAPPDRLSTTPSAGVTTRTPAGASWAAASHSTQIRAMMPAPCGRFLAQHGSAGVAVIARAGLADEDLRRRVQLRHGRGQGPRRVQP